MVLLMLAATIYGVVQMLVLAWPTRTIRLPTALLAVAVGVYACGVLTLVLELASTRTLAALADLQLADAVKRARYTVDPVLEELVKIAPLLLIGLNLRSRLQYGLTDYVVLGAGLGAGFGLLEATARFGMDADQAVPIAGGGWILPNLTPPYIPGISQVLSTAFPAPVGSLDISDLSKLATGLSSGTSIHLGLTAMAGLGVGLLLRGGGWARLLGLVPIGLACGHHAMYNYVAATPDAAAEPFASALESQFWLVPLISLAIAMALDLKALRWAKAVVPGALLLGERPGITALLRFGAMALPWSAWIALRFVLVRRSLWYFAARSAPAAAEPLRQVVSGAVAEMNVAGHRQAWRGIRVREVLLPAAGGWKRRAVLILVAVALTIPALLFAVVGSFPSRAGLQQSLSTGVGAKVMLSFAVAALIWITWRLAVGLLEMRRAAASPLGEVIAVARLRVLVALGALSVGAVLIYLRFTGTQLNDRVLRNYHLVDALNDFLMVLGFALMVLALFALFPPGGLVLAGGVVVAGTISAQTAAALGLSGILLMAVGANGRGRSGKSSRDSSSGADDQDNAVKRRPPPEKPQVKSPQLQNIINDLWRGTTNPKRVGDGTTMDAVRNEIKTGLPTKDKYHSIKLKDAERRLLKWIDKNRGSSWDNTVADDLLERIDNAFKTKRPN